MIWFVRRTTSSQKSKCVEIEYNCTSRYPQCVQEIPHQLFISSSLHNYDSAENHGPGYT